MQLTAFIRYFIWLLGTEGEKLEVPFDSLEEFWFQWNFCRVDYGVCIHYIFLFGN